MKIYEAADLAPDTYAGEYFQPSVKVYKKEDVDEEIIKKGELLKEMAEVLEWISEDGHAMASMTIGSRKRLVDILQKYREQAGDTNAE